ncbi:MAG: hypothetical protein ACPGVZ_08670 [Myxococcota bacterium]
MPENRRFYALRALHGRDDGAHLGVAHRGDCDRPHAAAVIRKKRVLCAARGGRMGR